MITTHRYRPQRLILFAMAIVVLLASRVAVAQVHTMPAHPSSHGGSFAYGSPAMPGGCTACGTAMVAGPNGYGCPKCMMGVDCATACGSEARWQDMRPMRFDAYGPGGYAGPSRMQHLAKYHIRPGDEIQIVYLVTRRQDNGQYRLMPGDEVSIESIADEDLDRGTLQNGLLIQPDGTITVRLLGQIQAAGLTVEGLRTLLEREYEAFYDDPAIDVTPVRTNTLAEDIRAAVGGLGGFTAQAITVTVMPDGHIRLPGIGGVNVQGFTLEQLKREINLRYAEVVVGLEVEPILTQQAPHFVYVLGQVGQPGRQELTAPTTVLGAIAAAGGHLPGGNLRQVVIFRRAEDWRLISTMLDLNGAIRGKRPTPADEIWLRDGDVVIVPERPIQVFNNFVNQVFTEGIYGIIPFGGFSVSRENL
ncbi:MAG: polysaccharide biosynthesis/export family protein [Rhodopirellula sp. JB044]|uniref:polysaccharide biosynthesis/export family protein n=1 Tax=Rhodopirellula sp. JB044 TaxID=3342844 RepID=UPI00370A3ACD